MNSFPPAVPKHTSTSRIESPEALAHRLRELELYERALEIARTSHITVHDMIYSRRRPAPAARELFYRYLRELGWSYLRIGALVGRDHTTVLSACRPSSASRASSAA